MVPLKDNKPIPSFKNSLPLFAFCVSMIYWIYLWFSSDMIIRYDSLGYEKLGVVLYHNNWIEYLTSGPNREPLYPWLISISMHLADLLSIV